MVALTRLALRLRWLLSGWGWREGREGCCGWLELGCLPTESITHRLHKKGAEADSKHLQRLESTQVQLKFI